MIAGLATVLSLASGRKNQWHSSPFGNAVHLPENMAVKTRPSALNSSSCPVRYDAGTVRIGLRQGSRTESVA